jgi:flagellin
MTVINTNVAATVTANAMKSNQRSMEQTMERLATGLRVNSAKDDAAGLAIGTKMDSQVRGFEQAVRNANDGISMVQTADGAAEQITGLLQRMRELAVQGQNDTNSTSDLSNLNDEFIALGLEIDRIADDTEFNGIKLMNTSSTIVLTVGTDDTDTIDLAMGDFNLAAGSASTAGVDTVTLNITDLDDLGLATDAASSITLTASDGTTFTFGQSQMAVHASASGFSDATITELAAQLTVGIAADTGSGFGTYIASATAADTIRFTQTGTTIGQAAITDVTLNDNGVIKTSATASAVTNTTTGGGGSAAAPMFADISAYKASGTHVQTSGTIAALDNAITGVNTARADFGAKISRLGFTIDNLENAIANTASARSSIMDADYAKETTELARTQIIAQAATAMLSQANQQAQSVLALLK